MENDEKKKRELLKECPWAFDTAKEAIRKYAQGRRIMAFNAEECMKEVVATFKMNYYRNINHYGRLSKEENDKIESQLNAFRPYFREMVDAKMLETSKRIKKRQISAATARAILDDVLQDFDWVMEPRCYRARLSIILHNQYRLVLYANYKRLIEEEGFAEHLHDLVVYLDEQSTTFGSLPPLLATPILL